MKIVALKEQAKSECRVAITPETAKLFCKKGHNVFVERNIGILTNFTDKDYEKAGAVVSSTPLEVLQTQTSC
jgi:NAD/NADP transhydrogenase alpha subunit